MAAYFGEVVEPISRAIFDDFSDEEEETHIPELRLTWLQNDFSVPPVIDVCFIIHGKLNIAFSEAYLINEKSLLVAELAPAQRNEDVHTKQKDLPTRIFTQNGMLICLVSPTLTPDMGMCFTKTVTPLLQQSKKVLCFTSESIYSFKTADFSSLPPAFIRELQTSSNDSKGLAPPLEIPNIISGIPAAVASWSEIHDQAASIIISYSDQQALDSVTASPLLELFKKLPYDVTIAPKPRDSKLWYYGHPQVIGGSSNIYI